MTIGALSQDAQQSLNDNFGVHSFRCFAERHDARNAWEFYVLFKTREGKAQRVDAWINDSETQTFDGNDELTAYVEGILINEIRDVMERLND